VFLLRSMLVAAVAVGAIVLAGCGGATRTSLKVDPPMSQSELEAALRDKGIVPINPLQTQPGKLSFALDGSGKCTASLLHRGKLHDEDGKEVKRSPMQPEFEFQIFNASGQSILKLSSGWSMDRLKSEASTRRCFDPSTSSLTPPTSQ
jgi:hypothetical protein